MAARKLPIRGVVGAFCALVWCGPALAWGDEGHRVVGLVAKRFLDSPARAGVDALLADDPDTLTAPDLASRTTWADRWRDSDRHTTGRRYEATRAWHFTGARIAGPDPGAVCSGHPPPPAGTPASEGPAQDCVVNKVEQFAAELADAASPRAQRVLALKYLLHFVGDLHQPLHAAGNHDRGGNDTLVLHPPDAAAESLHAYWDTTAVRRIGGDPAHVADALAADFADRRAVWSGGTPRDWAAEAAGVARDVAYRLPPAAGSDARGRPIHRLSETYEHAAVASAREQLAKAGFRLAALLNAALR